MSPHVEAPAPTILVIEDERPLLEAITKKLEHCCFEVVATRSVEQALGYLEDVKGIQCIWLDHYLLGAKNGLDFVAKIKEANSPWKTIPIFVVSNTASPDKVGAYMQLGVNAYYTKSDYHLDQIIADIRETLHCKTCVINPTHAEKEL
ncbi:MAG: response regulator [Patescibacteria group bacterium]